MAMVRSSATFSAQSLLWRHAHLILEKNSSRYYHTYIFKHTFFFFALPPMNGPLLAEQKLRENTVN